MSYADFDFYSNEYYGRAVNAEDFPRLAARASAFLDYCTMNRAKSYQDLPELKMACCALADQYLAIETAQYAAQKSLSASAETTGAEVSSETVGSWSKSYRSGGESASSALKATLNSQSALIETARMYMGHTGLLQARGYYA